MRRSQFVDQGRVGRPLRAESARDQDGPVLQDTHRGISQALVQVRQERPCSRVEVIHFDRRAGASRDHEPTVREHLHRVAGSPVGHPRDLGPGVECRVVDLCGGDLSLIVLASDHYDRPIRELYSRVRPSGGGHIGNSRPRVSDRVVYLRRADKVDLSRSLFVDYQLPTARYQHTPVLEFCGYVATTRIVHVRDGPRLTGGRIVYLGRRYEFHECLQVCFVKSRSAARYEQGTVVEDRGGVARA